MKWLSIACILLGLLIVGCTATKSIDQLIKDPNTTREQFNAAVEWEQVKADIANSKRMYSILSFTLGASLVCFGISVGALWLSRTLGAMGIVSSLGTAVLSLTFMSKASLIAIIGIVIMIALIIGAIAMAYYKFKKTEAEASVKDKAFRQVVDSMQVAKGFMTDTVKSTVNVIQDDETKRLVKEHKGA